jgi:hypothetical protein
MFGWGDLQLLKNSMIKTFHPGTKKIIADRFHA